MDREIKMKCGCIKDKFDDRDYLMRAYLPVIKLPRKIDYTQKMSSVRDQGDEGVCVGFAVAAGMKEYQERLDYQKFVELSPHQTDKPKKGVNPDAKRFRVLTYARILHLDELRMSLATKGPCVIGIEVFNGMMKTKTDIVPMPKKDEETLGGHAICCVGYEDGKKLVKFKNSWSVQWGAKGFGYLPYAYIERYMMDVWSSVDIEDPNPLTLASVISYQARAWV